MNKIHPAVQMAIDRIEFDYLEGGTLYWWPSKRGAIDSDGLRAIADYLDDRNAEWQREIQATIVQSPIENLVLNRLQ